MPKLKINGTEIDVVAGTSVLQAAEALGYEIPRFCYHDKLSVPANCRMCLVEVKGAPKPVASCAMACGENMEVFTDTALVKKARNGVMEMLLINHPLDCPICDQGGECDLQDQAVGYGFDRSRYTEDKRAVKDKNMGPLIKTVMTRCIQCTRCVRFGEDIGGVPELGLLNRGEDVEISTFIESAVSTELSGNMIDVCPVGALTSKPYAFTARPWELRKTETIDVMDAVGSNIRADSRGNEVMRILPRLHEGINEEWISDKTRFSYDGLKQNRLDRPYVRDAVTNKLREASWDEALRFVADKFKNTSPDKRAALVGPLAAVEDMFALKQLMNGAGSHYVDGMMTGLQIDTKARAGYIFNSGIATIEQADVILLVGTNPRYDAAMVNARIRKAYVANRIKIGVIADADNFNYPVTVIGQTTDDLKNLSNHPFAKILKNAKNPMMIIGAGAFMRPDGASIQKLCHDVANEYGVVRDGWNGFNVLHLHAGQVGALDLGLTNSNDISAQEFVYLLGVDADLNINKDAFVVYQGHHGDKGAARADVILPAAAFTEKDGLYVNTEGRVQMSKRVVAPVGDAKEDWKILRALSEVIGTALPFDNLYALRQNLYAAYPHFAKIDELPAEAWGDFGSNDTVLNAPLASPITNFYNTNVITAVSNTMRECSQTFVAHQHKEAAE